jgi:hypothetical protein
MQSWCSKAMKRGLMAIGFAVLAVSWALAQQKKSVPPPPKPADEGPSLEVTMKFIQDKLNDVGAVNYATYTHDNAVGNDWTNQFRVEATKVVADANSCRISYHWKASLDGKAGQDSDGWFLLKSVADVAVMPMEQDLKAQATAQGHPTWNSRIEPPVFVLKVHRADKGGNVFDFFDEQMANRVAKAMVHAVELCGGGSKPEPF